MSIIDQIRKDITRITTDANGWGVAIQFVSPAGQIINITGMHTEIWYEFDTDGNLVNTKLANVAVTNDALNATSYAFRDANGEVNFKNHKINVANVTGNTLNYIAKMWHPDEQTGLILIFLDSFQKPLTR